MLELALERLEGPLEQAAVGNPVLNLPSETSSFVGRDEDQKTLSQLLIGERLITLVGVGGVGKTRLALRLANDNAAHYPDGVQLVELASVAEPSVVPRSVSAALGIAEQARRAPVTVLAEVLQTKHMLLVLDNCEHLVDACAALTTTLLRVCPSLRILATSREPLGVPGEVVWHVAALSLPAEIVQASADEIRRSEAVRLFLERARTSQPALVMSVAELRAIAEVCMKLDGLPLAIELAAARLGVLAPSEMMERLEDRYRLLTTGSRGVPLRHRTLEAAMAWSFDLLSPAEQVLFSRLAVFAGGWTLRAAEGICTGGRIQAADVLDLLTQLVNKSLVMAEVSASGQHRYRELEIIREYAAHRLKAMGEEPPVRNQHADWYLRLAEEAERSWRSPHEIGWLDRLEADIDNLRAALSWCVQEGNSERALRFVGALHYFWLVRGFWQEGRSIAERLLTSDWLLLSSPTLQASAHHAAGILAAWQGDDTAAKAHLRKSLELYEAQESPRVALVWLDLGIAAAIHADHDIAGSAFQSALELGQERHDPVVVYRALYNLGELARNRQDYERARALHEESLRLSAGRDTRNDALALASLGRMAWMQGDFNRAAALSRESLQLWWARRDQGGIAHGLEGLAWAASGQRKARRAARLFGAVERLRETYGYPLPLPMRSPHEQCVADVTTRLGPQALKVAWAAGRALTVQDAIAEALEEDEFATGQAIERGASADASGTLSRREREVAALIARGYTNRQIATELVITDATAAKHIEHILDKLGLSSRAQVAVWVTQTGQATSRSTH